MGTTVFRLKALARASSEGVERDPSMHPYSTAAMKTLPNFIHCFKSNLTFCSDSKPVGGKKKQHHFLGEFLAFLGTPVFRLRILGPSWECGGKLPIPFGNPKRLYLHPHSTQCPTLQLYD